MENDRKEHLKQVEEDNSIMHPFKENQNSSSPVRMIAILVLIAFLGVGTGFVFSQFSAKTGKSVIPGVLNPNAPKKGQSYGDGDPAVFKDTAEGVVREGGIEGEGQYHLEREGGESQNVYMTSSLVDLSEFVGKKVKVWGETQKAQTAGWLMDVGKVEVL
jgi:hypothetical protein